MWSQKQARLVVWEPPCWFVCFSNSISTVAGKVGWSLRIQTVECMVLVCCAFSQPISWGINVMNSNKTGNKLHRSILRYGRLKFAWGWKMTHLSILRFFFFFFSCTFICLLLPPCNLWLIFKHFPTKILHFLHPVLSKPIGIGVKNDSSVDCNFFFFSYLSMSSITSM